MLSWCSEVVYSKRPPLGSQLTEGTIKLKPILEIARSYEGDVRVTDIALETSFWLDQARQQLESLSERGFCHK